MKWKVINIEVNYVLLSRYSSGSKISCFEVPTIVPFATISFKMK